MYVNMSCPLRCDVSKYFAGERYRVQTCVQISSGPGPDSTLQRRPGRTHREQVASTVKGSLIICPVRLAPIACAYGGPRHSLR